MTTDQTEFALYTNPKGQPVTHSSYSARQTFKKCPREFQLERVEGWSDKERRAAPLFGKCIEAGAQFHEDSDRAPGTAVSKFVQLWTEVKSLPEFSQLVYTAVESSYDSLMRAGKEMMRLYEIRAPWLPISTQPRALWQQTLRKKLFPVTEYDKLENKAILDLLSFPRWDHPLLPPILHRDVEGIPQVFTRKLIIDIKTSGVDLPTDFVQLDPQLAEYAWESRIPDVAFLWFVKCGHDLRKGSRVTLLEDVGKWHAGFELLVISAEKATQSAYVGTHEALAEYEAAVKDLRGKARDAAEMEFIREAHAADKIAYVLFDAITKQRLQFAAARITEQDMDEIGRDVAQTTVEMIRAHKEGYYPKLSGVRFPNEKCPFCAMRWICLNRPKERDEHLTRKGEEWLDGDPNE